VAGDIRRDERRFNLSLAEALAIELGPRGIDVVAELRGVRRRRRLVRLWRGRAGPRAMTADAVAVRTWRALRRRGGDRGRRGYQPVRAGFVMSRRTTPPARDPDHGGPDEGADDYADRD